MEKILRAVVLFLCFSASGVSAAIISVYEDNLVLSNTIWFEGAEGAPEWAESYLGSAWQSGNYQSEMLRSTPSGEGIDYHWSRVAKNIYGNYLDISLASDVGFSEFDTDPSVFGCSALRATWETEFFVSGEGASLDITMLTAGLLPPASEYNFYAWGDYELIDVTTGSIVGDRSTLTYNTGLLDGHTYAFRMDINVSNHWDDPAMFYFGMRADEVAYIVPEPNSLVLALTMILALYLLRKIAAQNKRIVGLVC